MPDYDDIVHRYKRLRAASFDMNNRMVKLLTRQIIDQAADQLGMLVRGVIHFKTEDESSVLMDFAIHDCWIHGRNTIDRYAALHPPKPGSEQEMVLAGIRRGFYSVFEVKSIVPGVGVEVGDLVSGQGHFMADQGLSQTATLGMALATRVFAFDDFLMTGGAGLPVAGKTRQQSVRLLRAAENQSAPMSVPERSELNGTVICSCLSAEDAPKIYYATPGEHAPEELVEALPARPPGRNDPCPCGSGKKYKKCCGR